MQPKAIRTLRADLSPIFEMDGTIEGWEGAVMFEAPHDVDLDKLDEIAQTIAEPWADVSEWSVEIVCKGLFKLTPREWEQKPEEAPDKECPSCRRGDGGRCVC